MSGTTSALHFAAFEPGLERVAQTLIFQRVCGFSLGIHKQSTESPKAGDSALPRSPADAGNAAVSEIQPYAVRAALTEKGTTLLAQVAFQLRKPHTPASSMLSRTASGERFFSASSRWHSSTSLRASRRFALASSSVSPCEIAAGISSTKQVYPLSGAGSKTAVTLMRFRVPRRTP
jgi:hypothetical protein